MWAAVILTIPLTSGLSIPDKIMTGLLLFIIGFVAEMTVDLVSRYLMILTMYYMPSIVKAFVGIATFGFLALFGFIIWVLTSLDAVSADFWNQFERTMFVIAGISGVGIIILLLLTKKNGGALL